MIDLHSHILPQLDDGAHNWDQALRMCAQAVEDGTTTVVLTPHVRAGDYPNTVGDILSRLAELKECVVQEGLPLTILPGSEVFIHPEIPIRLKDGSLLTLNQSRYLLLELPHDGVPPNTDRFIASLVREQITPIIAHPERNRAIQREPGQLARLAQTGALGQVTAGSLTGVFGTQAQETARLLLRQGLIHVIASDAHSDGKRNPIISRGLAEASRIVGEEAALNLVNGLPNRIINNQPIFGASLVPLASNLRSC